AKGRGLLDHWRRILPDGLKGPEAFFVFGDVKTFWEFGGFGTSCLCARRDPFFDGVEISFRNLLAVLRHLPRLDQFHDQAVLRLARREDMALVGFLEHEPAQSQINITAQFFSIPVAFEAMGLENRPDVALEKK